ncbi:MAG: hypothetical protein ACFFCX_16845 [Candidatus Sifarchaeia archaeon]
MSERIMVIYPFSSDKVTKARTSVFSVLKKMVNCRQKDGVDDFLDIWKSDTLSLFLSHSPKPYHDMHETNIYWYG